jgi:hypothetical protein
VRPQLAFLLAAWAWFYSYAVRINDTRDNPAWDQIPEVSVRRNRCSDDCGN